MSERFTLDMIRKYWTEQAVQHGQSHAASWSDQMVIEMEIREILQRLHSGDTVLDIGCANGYSTIRFAAEKDLLIRGLDFIPEMIDQARQRLSQVPSNVLERITFDVGDITDLQEPSRRYDKVVVVRVIINLGHWERQLRGLQECVRVLKPGGLLLLSEATLQGWNRLNQFRVEWGLTEIPMPPFNQYVDEAQVISAVAPQMELVEISNFASTYYVGTRLLKPLLIKATGADVDVADPNSEWNRWCASLPAWGNYGTQKLFVFRKH